MYASVPKASFRGLLSDNLCVCRAQRLNKNWSTLPSRSPKRNESMLPEYFTRALVPGQRKSPESSITSPTFAK
jgi:hypothetical protein